MPDRFIPACCLALLPVAGLHAQSVPDTLRPRVLPEATVVGYGQRLPLRRTAAAVGVVEAATVGRFSEASLAQAVNTLPGVRLEERATASYRLSVRGSTLRSPFGVRNVKVYYHDIPFTEASGSTPLNLLDAAQLGRIEVIKGPAGSAYGAGTGGVALLSNRRPEPGQTRTGAGFTAGSFGLRRYQATAETATDRGFVRVQYLRQELSGYREQSAQRRDVLALDGELAATDRQTLGLHLLYSDLRYQLPGGLTRAQFAQDPRQARPGTAAAPGTVAQRTFYASRTALLGITHAYRFGERLTSKTTVYGSGSVIRTPYLVDFERNTPLGTGGRTRFDYRTRLAGQVLRLAAGAELQTSFESSRNYQNLAGTPGPLRYDDEIGTLTGFAFGQADWELPRGWLLTAGASYNRLRYRLRRLQDALHTPAQTYNVTRTFRPEVSPRLAVLKELSPLISAYASVSTGFSPPTEEEIRPSDGSLNQALQAERGTSYEVGTRGAVLHQRLRFDVAAYDFRLRNTIVTRSNAQGTQLFYNAGNTRQRGVEVALSGWLWQQLRAGSESTTRGPASSAMPAVTPAGGLRAFVSYAYNHYRFGRYESGGNDFSGNRLTGTAPHTLTAGLDATQRLGFYLSPTTSHQARLPLNDANTDYAAGYWVFGARGGWRRTLRGRLEAELYAGVDNATNRRYSLGNDLNAFGGRYFQPAPGRNYYGGAALGWRW
ncbi:TonB-dependent receptor plug domain-containing protein [Hymenobacter sp. 15J16-1T3B]|uniref:TonB-dependent receptor family protein n=1 Tax=Hymenobacter sp. 15J16-1T3B TaxID=2886941 RepID=UPI001D1185E9|nr:TonB-dependent receptor [Hymenobacter sp. 15J16-1T3B]MCC3158677.1 TonB-dependent receptor plug domain-containing protein [Hymenobacter sp. 15J16-1T3B]